MDKAWDWISSNLLTEAGRGRLYKTGVGLFGLLVVFGIITVDESASWTVILERVLAFVTSLVALLHLTPDAVEDTADEDDASEIEDASATAE